MVKKMALGRGLGALIEDADTSQQRADAAKEFEEKKVVATEMVNEIDINKIEANPYQPRTTFDSESLQELSASISKLGIIQPLTVRELNGGYQLISGERRLRAAKLAGLKTVPAYVRKANDQGMLEMALVENIQRDDLDAIEVAISYQRLVDECSLTHDTLSERVGKKRATVTNYLRLLKLPAEIQLGIRERKLSMGHARSIIGVDDPNRQLDLYRKVIAGDLSVRKTEELVRQIAKPTTKIDLPQDSIQDNALEDNLNGMQERLQELFGWGVEVKQGKNGTGKIVISYRSTGELDELLARFNRVSE
jgi:ParB family chromosome partitioning protein